jgi:acetyl esterase/lipase
MRLLLPLLILTLPTFAAVQEKPWQPLWPEGAPGALGEAEEDTPSIMIVLPESGAPTPAVVVCPGGGYRNLAMDYEGTEVAHWLAENGIAGIVLRYRLGPNYHYPAQLQDALRAIRTVRHNAETWGIDPQKVGILGFSAGGHLTASAATLYHLEMPTAGDAVDKQNARPDFACPVYPVISMEEPFGHMGSRGNLLGETPDQALIDLVSLEKQVTAETAPCFIVHTYEDQTVPVENAILLFQALRKQGVPTELHIFERGRHGLGMGRENAAFAAWPNLFLEWLRVREILK